MGVAQQMFIHVKMPWIITWTLLRVNTSRSTLWFYLEIWGGNEGDETDFTHRMWLPYITLPLLAWFWVLEPLCVCDYCMCAHTRADVCLCMSSARLTFPQTWLTFPGDLKIWSLLCLKSCVLPSSQQRRERCSGAGSVPCLQGLNSAAFGAAHSHSPMVWSGEDLHYTLLAF